MIVCSFRLRLDLTKKQYIYLYDEILTHSRVRERTTMLKPECGHLKPDGVGQKMSVYPDGNGWLMSEFALKGQTKKGAQDSRLLFFFLIYPILKFLAGQ